MLKPAGKVARKHAFDWMDEDNTSKVVRRDKVEGATLRTKRKRLGHRQALQRRTMTDLLWKRYLEHTSNGHTRKQCADACKVTQETVEAYLIHNVAAIKELHEAEQVWLRRNWNYDQIDEILNLVSSGSTVKAACEAHGYSEKDRLKFFQLVRKDKTLRDWYDIAREMQAESWMDDSIDIADNTNDKLIDAKGVERVDHGMVQRDRLRIDTRWRTMGALNRKRFGEHKHIDHGGEIAVNHSVILANARKRLEKVRGTTIEGEATPVDTGTKQSQ